MAGRRIIGSWLGVIAMGVAAIVAAVPKPGNAQATQPSKPNVVLIVADDLGFSDLGCYGSEIRTPNLDRLAAQGQKWSRFYNASQCEDSALSLQSGLYSLRAERGLQRGLTLGNMFQSAGYRTMAVGKWKLGGIPETRGFHRAFGHLSGALNYFDGDETFHLDGEQWVCPSSEFYAPDYETAYALQFIKEEHQKNGDKPFFLYYHMDLPHSPLQATREELDIYRGKYRAGWEATRQARIKKQTELGLIGKDWQPEPRPSHVREWDNLTDDSRTFESARFSVYASMVDRMDQSVGRVVRYLQTLGADKNTLILFVSDAGPNPQQRPLKSTGPIGGPDSRWSTGVNWAWVSNAPFRLYKQNAHEGGVSTPFIACWPGVIPASGGAWTSTLGHVSDLMPTLCDVAGVDYNATFKDKPSPSYPPAPDWAKLALEKLQSENSDDKDDDKKPADKPREHRDSKKKRGKAGQKEAKPAPPPPPPPILGRPVPGLDGRSLLSALKGGGLPDRDLFFQAANNRGASVGQWKLVSHHGLPWELYDLAADRTETRDQAASQPERVKELEKRWQAWWDEVTGGSGWEGLPTDPDDYRKEPDEDAVAIRRHKRNERDNAQDARRAAQREKDKQEKEAAEKAKKEQEKADKAKKPAAEPIDPKK